MTWDSLIEHVLSSFSEEEPADLRSPDTWVLSQPDLIRMIEMAVEMEKEHQCFPVPAAGTRLIGRSPKLDYY